MWVKERGEDMESVLLQLPSTQKSHFKFSCCDDWVCVFFISLLYIYSFPSLSFLPQLLRSPDVHIQTRLSHRTNPLRMAKDPEMPTLLEDV